MSKIEMGKKYVTRDGQPVRIVCVDRTHERFPVVALIGLYEDDIEVFTAEGCFFGDTTQHRLDLVEATPPLKFPQFKRGDLVKVWDNDRNKAVRVFSHSSEHSAYAYSYNGGVTAWNFCEPFVLPEVQDESV